MKKTNKVISIILSAFMIMQMMTGMVFASSLAPSNLRWITGRDLGWNNDDKGLIAWNLVDGYDLYIIYIYKDNVQISTCLTERDEDYDFGYEIVWGDMKSGGTGNYTVKVATYGGNWDDFDKYENDEDIPVLGVSEMSEPFSYVGDATAKQESNNTEPVITAGSSDNNTSATQPESKTAVSATGEIECPSAVKVCYDLGIMPDVYENADKIVTYDEFMNIYYSFTGDTCRIDKKSDNITLEQICKAFCQYGIPDDSLYDEAVIGASKAGYLDGVHIYRDREVNITYAQLARIIYNVLTGIKLEITVYNAYGPDPSSVATVKNGALYDYGYVKYKGDVIVSGDTATINGWLYDWKNYDGIAVKDVVLSIADKDLTSGSDYELFVKDDTIVSAISLANLKNEKVSKDMTPPTVITLTIGDVNATVNGKSVVNDVAPMVINDRTMLPIRFIAEALGATVGWDEGSQKVSVKSTNAHISIKIGEKSAEVAVKKTPDYMPIESVKLDSPAFIENDRTYLPLRFVAENLGAEVQWDGATQTITITKQ